MSPAVNKLENIQVLRAAAALFVFFAHMPFVIRGQFGVDIFFCISGFIMMYVTREDTRYFLTKRLIRVVPLYWISLVGYILIMLLQKRFGFNPDTSIPITLKSVLCNIFLLPHFGYLVGVAWSLSLELFFYLIFRLACLISLKNRGLIVSAILILISLLSLPFPLGASFNPAIVMISWYSNPMMLEFILGILLYAVVYRLSHLHLKAVVRICLFLLSIVCLIICFWGMDIVYALTSGRPDLAFMPEYAPYLNFIYTTPFTADWIRVFISGIPAFFFALCFILATKSLKMPKPFVFLGDISFPFYLFHVIILTIVTALIKRIFHVSEDLVSQFDLPLWIKLAMSVSGFVLTCVAALICHIVIEKKLTVFLRRKLVK